MDPSRLPQTDKEKEIEEFVLYFMTKHAKLVSKIGYRYIIPNRYNLYDIKQYISERIIKIMLSRVNDANPIKNPEKYFKSCLEFYCIEFQRMHGFVFCLPKRPRKNCEQDELNIREHGFKYLGDLTSDEVNSLQVHEDIVWEDQAPVTESTSWSYLTGIVSTEESRVLDCIFVKNMTWNETSKYLNVPQSTCWFRKSRALTKIELFVNNITGDTFNIIKRIIRDGTD